MDHLLPRKYSAVENKILVFGLTWWSKINQHTGTIYLWQKEWWSFLSFCFLTNNQYAFHILYHFSTLMQIMCANKKNGDYFQGISSRRDCAAACHDKIIFICVLYIYSLFHVLRHIFQGTLIFIVKNKTFWRISSQDVTYDFIIWYVSKTVYLT